MPGVFRMFVGYMRVSSDSDRQTTNLQRDALLAAGVDERQLFEDRASGAKDDRPGLSSALTFVRPGDVLVVWKLDRLGRSLPHLLTIINSLRERMAALPFCHAEIRSPKPKPAAYPKAINTIGDHIRKRRLDLRLLQEQVAEQIGVHEMTITNWEVNATVPEVRYVPAIIQFLGYNPLSAAGSIPERLAMARRALGLSQRKMAKKLGVDPATLMGWETGRHRPTGKSLNLIEKAISQ